MGAQMPAILIEMGFITNAADCMLLNNDAHRESIIDGIVAGIKRHCKCNLCTEQEYSPGGFTLSAPLFMPLD